MSYTVINFKTKKALKEAVATYYDNVRKSSNLEHNSGVRCYQPGLGPDLSNHTGTVYLEGPHYPKPHTWYAAGEMVNGILVKVK